MKISAKRMAVLREHIRAESEHDMEGLIAGMTSDCFNDVVGVPKPFVGPQQGSNCAKLDQRLQQGFATRKMGFRGQFAGQQS